jgi:lysophospholipase L1-like esterase
MNARRLAAQVLRVALVALVSVALLEVTLVAVRRLPPLAGIGPLRSLAHQLYFLDRNYLQMDPAAIRWDPMLGYTLRPGEFRFSNTEFDTACSVNSLGVRDDEASLARPEVVVLGDSFAMGWGVEQQEAFPQVLEGLLRRKVLNAGISSYGTVRELRMLSRIDTSATRWVVIQFCNNDYFENRRFADEGPDVRPHPRQESEAAVESYRRQRRYWPGRYAASLLAKPWARLTGAPPLDPGYPDPADPDTQRLQARLLLKVLAGSPVDLSRFGIVLFELNAFNGYRGIFTPYLVEALRDPSLPEHLRRIVVLDLATELGPQHWFVIDDHVRGSGHRLIAERLAAVIAAAAPRPAAVR